MLDPRAMAEAHEYARQVMEAEMLRIERAVFSPMALGLSRPWEAPPPPPLQQAATAVLERPTGAPWQLPPVMPDDEYLRVAAKIGLQSPALIKAKLERFLVMRGWPVYDYDKVWAYLESLALQQGPRMKPCWKPLRQHDKMSGSVYAHAVPLHALLKVEELEGEFDKGVLAFAVSDYEAKVPDPFLMVTTSGLPKYVIDVWDEPGFHV